jgi:hypothetical protein
MAAKGFRKRNSINRDANQILKEHADRAKRRPALQADPRFLSKRARRRPSMLDLSENMLTSENDSREKTISK